MPRVRCRFYDDNGAPINGGCKRVGSCDFVHPSDPLWGNTVRPRSTFNSNPNAPPTPAAPNFLTGTNSVPTGPRQKRRREEESEQTSGSGRPSARSSAPSTSISGGWGNMSWGEPSSYAQADWRKAAWGESPSSAQADWGKSAWGEPSAAAQDGWGAKTAGSGSSSWDLVWNAPVSSKAASTAGGLGRPATKGKEKADVMGDSSWGNDSFKNTASSAVGTQPNMKPQKAETEVVWGDPPGSPIQTAGWGDSTGSNGGWAASDSLPQINESKESVQAAGISQDYVPNSSRNVQAQSGAFVAPTSSNFQEDATIMDVSSNHDAGDAMDQDPPELVALPPPTPTIEDQPSRRPTLPSGAMEEQRALREGDRGCAHEEFIKALTQAVQTQLEYEQAESSQAQNKALQCTKSYAKSGPLALEKLKELNKEQAATLGRALKQREHAMKRFVHIADRYHANGTLPPGLTEEDGEDPMEFVNRSIDGVRTWVDRAVRIVETSRASGEPVDLRILSAREPPVRSDALRVLESRIEKMEEREEGLSSYLRTLQESNEQTAVNMVVEKWRNASAPAQRNDELRMCYEREKMWSAMDSSLQNVGQRVKILAGRSQHCEAGNVQIRAENQRLNERIAQLEAADLTRARQLRDNTAEIEDMKSRIRAIEEARKQVPAPIDVDELVKQLQPVLIRTAREDMTIAHEAIIQGVNHTLAAYQTQIADVLWQRLEPVLHLTAAIQKMIDEQASSPPGPKADPTVSETLAAADLEKQDSLSGWCRSQ